MVLLNIIALVVVVNLSCRNKNSYRVDTDLISKARISFYLLNLYRKQKMAIVLTELRRYTVINLQRKDIENDISKQ